MINGKYNRPTFQGFTLIELLVTMVIASVLMLLLASLFSNKVQQFIIIKQKTQQLHRHQIIRLYLTKAAEQAGRMGCVTMNKIHLLAGDKSTLSAMALYAQSSTTLPTFTRRAKGQIIAFTFTGTAIGKAHFIDGHFPVITTNSTIEPGQKYLVANCQYGYLTTNPYHVTPKTVDVSLLQHNHIYPIHTVWFFVRKNSHGGQGLYTNDNAVNTQEIIDGVASIQFHIQPSTTNKVVQAKVILANTDAFEFPIRLIND